jgi:hypothetical protein
MKRLRNDTEEKPIRAKTGDLNWKNFYINRRREKNAFVLMGKTFPIVRAITQRTNQNY